MKKRYLVLAGVLAAAMAVSGCGKKDNKQEETDNNTVQATVAPAKEDKGGGELVEMQKTTQEDIKNVMGDKKTASGKLTVINKTGADVKAFYVRPTTEDEEDWGEDLIKGAFTLKERDKALYYFDRNRKDDEGKVISRYDVRIVYVDEDRTECYFRKLPLTAINQLTLLMDGSGEASIPYATYTTGTDRKEISTLQEVKKRLGLLDDNDYEDEDEEDQDAPQPTEAPAEVTPTPGVADEDEPETEDPGFITDEGDDARDLAASFIGRPLEELIGACGDPIGEDYVDEPETGETGYHYYDTFTISTTVDENGNEVVAGVW